MLPQIPALDTKSNMTLYIHTKKTPWYDIVNYKLSRKLWNQVGIQAVKLTLLMLRLEHFVNDTAADALAPCIARSSAKFLGTQIFSTLWGFLSYGPACLERPQSWVASSERNLVFLLSSWQFRFMNVVNYRSDSRFASSQWETPLLCNAVSHWLGASLESDLQFQEKGSQAICNTHTIRISVILDILRADSMFAPSQWEMTLLSNDASHWLGRKPRINPDTVLQGFIYCEQLMSSWS